LEIDAEPLLGFEIKPEIDLLAQININKNKYQKIIKQYFPIYLGANKKKKKKKLN
jgi:hypothetical protein